MLEGGFLICESKLRSRLLRKPINRLVLLLFLVETISTLRFFVVLPNVFF